jgi:hypothetical protein
VQKLYVFLRPLFCLLKLTFLILEKFLIIYSKQTPTPPRISRMEKKPWITEVFNHCRKSTGKMLLIT